MPDHNCDALIITCIDFRFQKYINDWVSENFQPKTFDRVAIAGGVFDLDYVLKQAEISHRLHHVKKIILINHEDCGAYGEAGTVKKHAEDLKAAGEEFKKLYPEMEIKSYYLHLDGNFEDIS
ncbi:MAG: carbonic anhydrase [Microgenomates group bacterium]|jgi:carbonic anhydrase